MVSLRRLAALSVTPLMAVLCTSAAASPARPSVSLPPVAGVVDYQLGGSYRPAHDV